MCDFNLPCIEWYLENNKYFALNYEGRLANELLNTLNLTNLSQVNFVKNHGVDKAVRNVIVVDDTDGLGASNSCNVFSKTSGRVGHMNTCLDYNKGQSGNNHKRI